MNRFYFKLDPKKTYNACMRTIVSISILICLVIFQAPCIAAEGLEDTIQLYDEEMLLKDLDNESSAISDTLKPIVQNNNKHGKLSAMEVPRSIRYDTALFEEGAKLYKSGKFHEAAAAFETALKQFGVDGFADGEAATLGNLYLTYLEIGNENKALECLEEYRKKRRRK